MESEKRRLRSLLKQQRAGLSPAQRVAASQTITDSCLRIVDWEQADRIHCYQTINDMHEVDTGRLLAAFRRHGAKVDIPATNGSQPTVGELDASYDAIIVPMLGFDDSLHRLGYGGGYYDRLLAAHPAAHKIGVCFESGYVESVPVGRHDRSLDVVVTEHRVYRAQLV